MTFFPKGPTKPKILSEKKFMKYLYGKEDSGFLTSLKGTKIQSYIHSFSFIL